MHRIIRTLTGRSNQEGALDGGLDLNQLSDKAHSLRRQDAKLQSGFKLQAPSCKLVTTSQLGVLQLLL
jgi:hypothetical protein